jgi:hypothetical protein
VRLRVYIELCAVLFRTFVTAVLVLYFNQALLAFAWAQFTYSVVITLSYYLYFARRIIMDSSFHFNALTDLIPQRLSKSQVCSNFNLSKVHAWIHRFVIDCFRALIPISRMHRYSDWSLPFPFSRSKNFCSPKAKNSFWLVSALNLKKMAFTVWCKISVRVDALANAIILVLY